MEHNEHNKVTKEPFKSETSIFSAPTTTPKVNQFKMPTWGLLAILIVAFFVLKTFIYITDEKRKGR
jgi:hypothetical protein